LWGVVSIAVHGVRELGGMAYREGSRTETIGGTNGISEGGSWGGGGGREEEE